MSPLIIDGRLVTDDAFLFGGRGSGGGEETFFILLESGDYLLLESGDKVLKE